MQHLDDECLIIPFSCREGTRVLDYMDCGCCGCPDCKEILAALKKCRKTIVAVHNRQRKHPIVNVDLYGDLRPYNCKGRKLIRSTSDAKSCRCSECNATLVSVKKCGNALASLKKRTAAMDMS